MQQNQKVGYLGLKNEVVNLKQFKVFEAKEAEKEKEKEEVYFKLKQEIGAPVTLIATDDKGEMLTNGLILKLQPNANQINIYGSIDSMVGLTQVSVPMDMKIIDRGEEKPVSEASTLKQRILDSIEGISDDKEAVLMKWRMLLDAATDLRFATRGDTCRYCEKYNKSTLDFCKPCPIYKETGLEGCATTPFDSTISSLNLLIKNILEEIEFLEKL